VADKQGLLQVDGEQRGELESWSQSRTLPAGEVFRVRLILALADGMSYREIECQLGASAATVSKWKSRFQQQGMEGLHGRHQGSKPRRATPGVQGASHPTSTAETVRSQHALVLPQAVSGVGGMASNDPEFEAKAADIIDCMSIRRSTRLCSAWMRRRLFKHSIDSIQYCRYRLVAPSDMGLNIIVTACYRYMRH
jgi:hypothetical protein